MLLWTSLKQNKYYFYSPNTPGLRRLQGKQALEAVISQVLEARDTLPKKIPVLVKIAPDLEKSDKEDIATVILENSKVQWAQICNACLRPDILI